MTIWQAVLFLHLLGATVWTGGHLVLALRVLPGALRAGDPEPVRRFEALFEPIGLHVALVTMLSLLFLMVGLGFRTGGLF